MFTSFPYPGLRPFSEEETDIFFGRETQVDQLLDKLGEGHFLGIVGPSGCGKSSLVRAGLLDALATGFMAEAGASWRWAVLRPGSRPTMRLAKALVSEKALGPELCGDVHAASFIHATLRRGPLGLVEVLRETPLPDDTNLLVIVDQFEEIFRYHREGGQDEANAFVALLLESAKQREQRIYVVLTMRSDYLGDCALFTGLPEAMNESQYLTPRLTREQRRAVIEGPSKVFGTTITPELVNRLLNDMGPDPDQLPLMQHVLRRMWIRAGGTPIDSGEFLMQSVGELNITHYEGVGGLDDALSLHADEAFDELSPHQQQIAEVLFKCLSERGADQRDVRRPVTISEIAEVAGVTPKEVILVVEAFRDPDRSFLTPPAGEKLYPNTVLDISHETLIRQWKRLNDWVIDEGKSAETYRHLEESARRWESKQGGLWDALSVENALHWKDRARPNPAWAKRYEGDFDLAMKFLEASDSERRRVAEKEEAEHRRKLEQAQALARSQKLAKVAYGWAFALMAVLFINFYWDNRQTAKRIRSEVLAAQAGQIVHQYPSRGLLLAVEAVRLDSDNRKISTLLRLLNEVPGQIVPDSAEISAVHSNGNRVVAGRNDGTVHLWDTSRGFTSTLPSFESSLELAGLRKRVDTIAVAGGRVAALAEGDLRVWNIGSSAPEHELAAPAGATTLALSENGELLACGAGDGAIHLWSSAGNPEGAPVPLDAHGSRGSVEQLAFSRDGKWLSVRIKGGEMELWRLEPTPLRAMRESGIWALDFSSDSSWLMLGTSRGSVQMFRLTDKAEVHTTAVHDFSEHPVSTVRFSPDMRWAISGGAQGTLRRWDFQQIRRNGTPTGALAEPKEGAIVASAISSDGRWLVTATQYGPMRLWPLLHHYVGEEWMSSSIVLRGHEAPVRALAFTSNDDWLVSRDRAENGEGGTTRIWNIAELATPAEAPIEASATAIVLSENGHLKVTGLSDGRVEVLDLDHPQKTRTLVEAPGNVVRYLAFSPKHRWLGAVSIGEGRGRSPYAEGPPDRTGMIWVLDGDDAKEAWSQRGITAIGFGPGDVAITADDKSTVRLWDLKPKGTTERSTLPWNQKAPPPSKVDISPDGAFALAASESGQVRVWLSSSDWAPVDLVYEGGDSTSKTIDISPNGEWLSIASSGRCIEKCLIHVFRVADIQSGSGQLRARLELRDAGNAPVTSMDTTKNGVLITAHVDGTARVYDLSSRSGRAKRVFRTFEGAITSVTVSPDDTQFFTGGRATGARVWDIDREELPVELSRLETGIMIGVFPKNKKLVTAGLNGSVRRWTIDLTALTKEARRRAGRSLSRAEWNDHFPGEDYPGQFVNDNGTLEERPK